METTELLQDRVTESYLPEKEERDFVLAAYRDFLDDKYLKDQALDIIGSSKDGSVLRNLQMFWDESNDDYNADAGITDLSDPVIPYSSSIAKDKTNQIITSLVQQIIYPSVIAQNSNQEIDNVMGRVSRAILEWAHENDGRPAESGHAKMIRYVHKLCVEGTVHVQDDIIDNKLCSTLVPNEEIFIPNFWQPNIQLQSHLFRVQSDMTYMEGNEQFGHLPNWKYVQAGNIPDWVDNYAAFKGRTDGIKPDNKIQIIRRWLPVPVKKVKDYIIEGRLPDHVKRAKYFNIIINGVLMFPVDNLMPYHDGYYPINKEIFEMFSKSEFYWGNSNPNKMRNDKKYYDGWKTLLRYKGKISAIPPLLTFNGALMDSNVVVPGMITAAPAGMKPEDVMAVPGLPSGVNSSELSMLRDSLGDMDRQSPSPQMAGSDTKKRQTAKETLVADSNIQRILMGIAIRISLLTEARTFPILYRLFQFLPKSTVKKLVVPNQSLPSGKTGSYEIIFSDFKGMTQEKAEEKDLEVYKEEKASGKIGKDKKLVYVDINYLKELDLYVKVTADTMPKKSGTMRMLEAESKWNIYRADPIFNKETAARNLVREFNDDENAMVVVGGGQQPQQGQGGQSSPQGQNGDNPVAGVMDTAKKDLGKTSL